MLSRLMTRREQFVAGGLAVALLTGSATVWMLQGEQQPPALEIERPPVAGVPEAQRSAPSPEKPLKPPTLVTREAAEAVLGLAEAPTPTAELGIPAPMPEPVVETIAPPAPHLGVSVTGAVRAPGFYWLPQDARVQELIDAAGGVTEDADIADIKLSARLIDATTLSIPRVARLENEDGVIRGKGRQALLNPAPYTNSGIGLDIPAAAPPVAPSPTIPARPDTGNVAATPSTSGKVNVNTASANELDTLPGIGPAFAQRIIEHRPFESIEDLNRVPGIAEKRLEALRDHVTVE